jgi:hypothetical protein
MLLSQACYRRARLSTQDLVSRRRGSRISRGHAWPAGWGRLVGAGGSDSRAYGWVQVVLTSHVLASLTNNARGAGIPCRRPLYHTLDLWLFLPSTFPFSSSIIHPPRRYATILLPFTSSPTTRASICVALYRHAICYRRSGYTVPSFLD